MNLTPIPTKYKKYSMKSRLEARWAVYFDLLGIPWQYEPEGFRMGRVCYLPDFAVQVPVRSFTPAKVSLSGVQVPKFEEVQAEQVWVEVKPSGKALSGNEIVKIREFALATVGKAIYVVVMGDPLEYTGRSFGQEYNSVHLCGARWDKVRKPSLVLHPLYHSYKVSKAATKAGEDARGWEFGKRKGR